MRLGYWVKAQTARSPQEALELLRAQPGAEWVGTPFRYAPRETYEQGLTTEQINHAFDVATVQDVDVAGLVAGQHTVSRKVVERYLLEPTKMRRRGQKHAGGWLVDYPLVARRGGVNYIHDGTHRSTSLVFLGAKRIAAYVADLDAALRGARGV